MALSGTLETFSLPDVLRLLASTKKSGLLELSGDRGLGRVWVADGAIVAASTDGTVRPDEAVDDEAVDGAVFDLLRFSEGTFEFEPGREAETRGEPRDVEEALTAAEALLAEWREIEAVVPSLAVRVRLVSDVDDEVRMSSEQWQLVVRIGDGRTARTVANELELGEMDTCRRLRDLIELGLAEVDERTPEELAAARAARIGGGVDAGAEAARVVPAFEPPAFATATIGSPDWEPPATLGPDAITADPWASDEDADAPELADVESGDVETSLVETSPVETSTVETSTVETSTVEPGDDEDVAADSAVAAFLPSTPHPEGPPSEDVAGEEIEGELAAVDHDEGDEDGDDLLSQLANLSPKAAAAIEATADVGERADRAEHGDDDVLVRGLAAHRDGDDVADAAVHDLPLAAGSDDDDSVNQNLLLRFLSSTKQ